MQQGEFGLFGYDGDRQIWVLIPRQVAEWVGNARSTTQQTNMWHRGQERLEPIFLWAESASMAIVLAEGDIMDSSVGRHTRNVGKVNVWISTVERTSRGKAEEEMLGYLSMNSPPPFQRTL